MAMLSAYMDGCLSWNSVWPCLVHTRTVVSAGTVGVAMLGVYIDGGLSWNRGCGHA